jgi:hypothetical protein
MREDSASGCQLEVSPLSGGVPSIGCRLDVSKAEQRRQAHSVVRADDLDELLAYREHEAVSVGQLFDHVGMGRQSALQQGVIDAPME